MKLITSLLRREWYVIFCNFSMYIKISRIHCRSFKCVFLIDITFFMRSYRRKFFFNGFRIFSNHSTRILLIIFITGISCINLRNLVNFFIFKTHSWCIIHKLLLLYTKLFCFRKKLW